MAKTVKRPDYPYFEDTPYITQSRDLQNRAYGYLGTSLDNFNNFNNPEQYQAIADAYTQAQWNDLNRGYQQAINTNAARERNRLGTYGASSSLYNTNTLQNQYNDLASRVASNTANMYNQLVNEEYNRRLNALNANNQLWTQYGKTNYGHDYTNHLTKINNIYNDWIDDVEAKQAKNSMWGGLIEGLNAVGGAVAGGIFGGPMGAMAGQEAGSELGGMFNNALGLNTTQNTSRGGLNLGATYSTETNPYQQYSNNQNWLNNTGIGNYNLSTSDLQDTLNNSSLYQAWNSRGFI